MKRLLIMLGVAVALAALPLPATADTITFAGSSGTLAASVSFAVNGSGTLTVVLTNTATSDVAVPSDVLTAVFFDIAGDPTLGKLSALLTAGSSVFYDADGQPVGGIVGGEWGYLSGLNQYGANQGISSSGFSAPPTDFGPATVFPGADLEGPAAPDGVQYGLLSAGDNTGTGNGGITGSGGLIKNSVTFTLNGLGSCTTVASCGIGNVTFQYGTALSEGHFSGDPGTPVPEPGTLLLLGAGLTGLAARRRRR